MENAKDSVPKNQTEGQQGLNLNPAPYGADVFTDFERRKSFMTLHFRRQNTSRALAVSLIKEVIDELDRAGLLMTGPAKIRVYGDNVPPALPTAKTKYTCYLEAAVQSQADTEAEMQALGAAMRRWYAK